MLSNLKELERAAELIKSSSHTTTFTGAGISVESGIPPFRGSQGLYKNYNRELLDISYFYEHPVESWELNKEIFYDVIENAKPNKAHVILARMEEEGLIKSIITQNIDNLHQEAGSKNVYEFHGSSRRVLCTECGNKYEFEDEYFLNLPPKCPECNGILKPDYIFFGEEIPEPTRSRSFDEAIIADCMLIIGTTGEVEPASTIPFRASENGARIIEINIKKSNYTEDIADVFIEGKATDIMDKLYKNINR